MIRPVLMLVHSSFILFVILNFVYHVGATSKPGDDESLHESQIPAPTSDEFQQQPTPEEIQSELVRLYSKYDENSDKQLSVEEVKKWLDEIHLEITQENLDRQWAYYEPVTQEVHSWHEYEPVEMEVLDWEKYKNKTFTEEMRIESYNDEQGKAVWETMLNRAQKRWEVADANNDTILTKDEFKDFMWPEESSSDAVKQRLVEEGLEDMDSDGDKLINMEEYLKHLITITPEADRVDPEWTEVQKNHFHSYLDKDKDGSLNPKELEYWLTIQTDRHNEEAARLVASSDENKDQVLSVDEIKEGYNNFFTLISPKFWNKYYPDEQLYGPSTSASHDEL
ncbi:calumenin [Tetranychus urticae]|uniref:EF-hand domain-containing protein n=1 Tax=Tetranychus urticae TaxID=32264 RepID=T1JX55_TETUR|nr:calumenin [Tetranychus urticae]